MGKTEGVQWNFLCIWNIRERRKSMEVVLMNVKPYKGKYAPRAMADRIRDKLELAQEPDRTVLKKEAKEFELLILKRRENAR